MLKLHGFPVSNFTNMVKHALLEKGVAFEEVQTAPNQEPAYLAKSPMGKIPALETDRGFICETNVILEYIEETHPAQPLYPADPFERARMKQLVKTIELYVEMPAHGLVMVLFGAEPTPAQREATRPALEKGLAALRRQASFAPWVAGGQFSIADIFLYHSLSIVVALAGKLYDWDVVADVPGMREWQQRMAQRPITQRIDAATQAAMAEFMKSRAG